MNFKKLHIGLLLAILGLAVVGVGYLQSVYKIKISADANSPRIYVQTSKNSFVLGEQVSASIIVDGAAQSFTSFKADVALNNLSVVDGSLVLGSSVTNWQKQPSASSLSFLGGVQGTTTSITVYTMSLKATAAGTASISLSNGSILQVQPDGMTISDILGSVSGVTYTVTVPETVTTPTVNNDAGSTTTTPTTTKKSTVTKKTTTPATVSVAPAETPVVTETPVVEEIAEEPAEPHQSTESISGSVVAIDRILLKNHTDRDDIILSGKADSNSDLTINIYSKPLIKKTRSDSSGNWSINIGSLEAGDHRVEVTYADSPSLTPKVITTFKVVKSLNYYIYGGAALLLIVILILLIIFIRKKRRANQPIVQNSAPLQMPQQPSEIAPNNDLMANQNFIAPIPSTKDAQPTNQSAVSMTTPPKQTQSDPTLQTPAVPVQNAPISQPQPNPISQPIVPVDNQGVESANKSVASSTQSSQSTNNRIDSISRDTNNIITKINDDNPNF